MIDLLFSTHISSHAKRPSLLIYISLYNNKLGRTTGKADSADRLEWGSGAKWLKATIAVCAAFYLLAFVGIGLLYHYFSGCGGNTAIITMTLLGIVALTVLQLSGFEGSLLTSSVISLYVVYLGYSAVSKNPYGLCNPQLAKENDPLGIAMGLMLTDLSLAWTGWSWTAEDRLSSDGVKKARSLGKPAPRPPPSATPASVKPPRTLADDVGPSYCSPYRFY